MTGRATGHDALPALLPGFVGTTLPGWVAARLRDGLGGVCLFGHNIADPARLRALTAEIRAANPYAIVAIDEEGGEVTRLHAATGSPDPGNAVLGRLDDVRLTRAVGERVGRRVGAVGANLALGPDADVNANPRNPVIGVRSFGADPWLVARHTAAWVRGLQVTGVAASAKHFPGHGDTAQDSHLALPVVDVPPEVLRERDLVPFAAAVEAGVRTVMTSHILVPQVDDARPATFSRPILQGLLREELGFAGVIVSDALDMAGASAGTGIARAAVRALDGGCDLLCLGSSTTEEELGAIEAEVAAALGDGRLPRGRLTAATARVVGLGRDLAPVPPAGADGPPVDGDAGPGGDPDEAGPVVTADAVRRAFDGQVAAGPAGVSWIRLETGTNIAVGAVPWGPFAAGARPALTLDGRRHDPAAVLALPTDRTVVLVGRDLHRHGWVRRLVDDVRAGARTSGHTVQVVDMGWPDPDRRYSDVATFGASRLVGEALLEALGPDAGTVAPADAGTVAPAVARPGGAAPDESAGGAA